MNGDNTKTAVYSQLKKKIGDEKVVSDKCAYLLAKFMMIFVAREIFHDFVTHHYVTNY